MKITVNKGFFIKSQSLTLYSIVSYASIVISYLAFSDSNAVVLYIFLLVALFSLNPKLLILNPIPITFGYKLFYMTNIYCSEIILITKKRVDQAVDFECKKALTISNYIILDLDKNKRPFL